MGTHVAATEGRGRRDRARVLLALVAILVAVGGTGLPGSAEEVRPNFVVVVLDDAAQTEFADYGELFGALDSTYMDDLNGLIADHGVTFPNFLASTPVCCPARASLLSGQYHQNHKVSTNSATAKFAHGNTLARWLDDAGYETSLIGKYLNGYACANPVPVGWDDWQHACKNTNSQYKYTINDNGVLVPYEDAAVDYQVDVISARAQETIGELAAGDAPFFVYLAPTVPHGPTQVAPRYRNATVVQTPLSDSFDEADVTDKPPWIQALPRITASQRSAIVRSEQARMRMLLAADDLIEQTVRTLATSGVLDDTYIFVLNDNGYLRGEHRFRSGKGEVYRESMAAGPLFMRGPGLPSGVVNEALVGTTDVAPTIASLAGAVAGRSVDGLDVGPAIADPTVFDDRVFLHFTPAHKVGTVAIPAADGIRVGTRAVYFEHRDAGRAVELYDYTVDPFEMDNKASDPAYAELLAVYQATLAAAKTCTGPSCHLVLADR